MDKYVLRIMILVAEALVFGLIILLCPIDKKYQYAFVKSACSLKSNYIYHRIYEDTLPIDVVFIGSSHTMCGINDSVVQKALDERGWHLQVSNMSFCRSGRDIDYVILKDLMQHKKPKWLVLEVKTEEPELGHPDFGYIADIGDILMPTVIINQSYFSDLANAYTVRLNYIQDIFSRKNYNTPYEAPHLAFLRANRIADTSVLYAGARFRWNRYYSHTRSAWSDRIMTRYPKSYVKRIIDLAKSNDVKVVMLYIPDFGYPYHKPKELNYYRQMADVMLMPDSFFDDEKNWMEDIHLNCSAAAILSDSVAHYLAAHMN
jgi:hypothetical protein